MANRICIPMVEVPEYLVATIRVPAGKTIYPGNIVVAESVDAAIAGNFSVYAPEQPATANLGMQMALVINGGFEQLPDGRRPEGQPDYSKYEFIEGDVVTVVFMVAQMRFEISADCFTGTPEVNAVAYPVDGADQMEAGASVPVGTFSSIKLMAQKYFRIGGKFGGEFVTTYVVKVQNPA